MLLGRIQRRRSLEAAKPVDTNLLIFSERENEVEVEHFRARFVLGLFEACSINFQIPLTMLTALLYILQSPEQNSESEQEKQPEWWHYKLSPGW